MSNREFTENRTALANAFAEAGAKLLAYQPLVSTAVAMIPGASPQKYAVAGTLKGILSMAGKMMGEDGGKGLEGLARFDFTKDYLGDGEYSYFMEESSDGEYIRFADVERLLAAPAAKPVDRDGWMVDQSLIYRLNADGVNCDEINVTMVNGSRDMATRHDAAIKLLAELTSINYAVPQPTGDLTDEAIDDVARRYAGLGGIEDYRAFANDVARAAIAAYLARQPKAEQPHVTDGFVVAPHFRGYAHLGIGAYVINHSAKGELAELVISVATDEEKAGRTVGDTRDNAPDAMVQPEAMAVRLRFENVAGLDALEQQLRFVRSEHFPESIALKVVAQAADQRFFMDHGVWHDRVTGQHMWTQDQYDEQWRDMYKAGHEDAAIGFNMLTGKPIHPDAPGDADARCAQLVNQVHYWMDRGDRATIALDAAEAEITELRAHLARQAQAEPVAVVDEGDDGLFIDIIYGPDGSPLKCGDKLYLAAPAAPAGAQNAQPIDGVRWDLFPGFMIDHHEGDIVSEESLQGWVAEMLKDPDYIRVCAKSAVAQNAEAIRNQEEAEEVRSAHEPLNGIPATHRHDEGAIARCSYCGRYSLDPATLSDRQPFCECGKQHGWCGSFKRPSPDAKWSGKAPALQTGSANTQEGGDE